MTSAACYAASMRLPVCTVFCTTRPGRCLAGNLLIAMLSGCATVVPTWSRLSESAAQAARDPWVWAPLAGAAGLQLGHADQKISRWAMRETPLFGSASQAATWSDTLRSVAVVADATTLLLTPAAEDSQGWVIDTARGYTLDLVAATAAIGTTHLLKQAAGRLRPSGTDTESFPSGHTTTTAAYSRLAQRNLGAIAMDPTLREGLRYGLDAVTVATAWSRIEAGAHYPSDTLVGVAIGSFSASFFKQAFGATDGGLAQGLAVEPLRGGLALRWAAAF